MQVFHSVQYNSRHFLFSSLVIVEHREANTFISIRHAGMMFACSLKALLCEMVLSAVRSTYVGKCNRLFPEGNNSKVAGRMAVDRRIIQE